MKLESKLYCMHNIVSIVIEKLVAKNKNIEENEIIYRFSQSKTYEKLFDEKTCLWMEGPDYIIELYEEELNIL